LNPSQQLLHYRHQSRRFFRDFIHRGKRRQPPSVGIGACQQVRRVVEPRCPKEDQTGAHWNVPEAHLFGSQAKGTAREDSDVDVALVLDSQENGVLLTWEMLKLCRDIDLMIESHPINLDDWNEGTAFAEEVKRTGVRIA